MKERGSRGLGAQLSAICMALLVPLACGPCCAARAAEPDEPAETGKTAKTAETAGPWNAGARGNPYGRWAKGPPADPSFFPLAVWLQSPRTAERYRAAGINVFVGLWKGPTEEQLALLKRAGMRVVCDQNEVGLEHRDDPTIVGWMHGDEPDNAQSLGKGKGYGPPVPPEKVFADYEAMRAADPARPVLLNLGQGVAWDAWHGRGVRSRHPEDYPEYLRGCDVASFDIYPVVHPSPEVAGKLWFVPRGVDRLREWSRDQKVVWNCIECTRIGNVKAKPTPRQVKSEVWMSLVHGSMGIIYFVHQFEPEFVEAALLADPEMLAAVTALNRQVLELAPVLNSPGPPGVASARSSDPAAPVDVLAKRHGGATYLFAAGMRAAAVRASFDVKGLPAKAEAEVLGEERRIPVAEGTFEDAFEPYGVHLYRVR
ncbi:MAG: hypothetical protein HY721_28120 [Planctomycetes bacterium]|nr:hypothetical protein [Planctomycetota bacterium]